MGLVEAFNSFPRLRWLGCLQQQEQMAWLRQSPLIVQTFAVRKLVQFQGKGKELVFCGGQRLVFLTIHHTAVHYLGNVLANEHLAQPSTLSPDGWWQNWQRAPGFSPWEEHHTLVTTTESEPLENLVLDQKLWPCIYKALSQLFQQWQSWHFVVAVQHSPARTWLVVC